MLTERGIKDIKLVLSQVQLGFTIEKKGVIPTRKMLIGILCKSFRHHRISTIRKMCTLELLLRNSTKPFVFSKNDLV